MNNCRLITLVICLGLLLPVSANAANLIANEPATIYYTTNGSDPNSSTALPASGSSRVATMVNNLATTISDGIYNLVSSLLTDWVGTDASRTTSASADYAFTYGDESSVTYTLPPIFGSFPFYGTYYNQLTADTNGNIWFTSAGSAHSINLASTGRGPVIAAWNNDLSSYNYGGVFIQHKTSPERVVIEWQTETFTEEGSFVPNNFEVVLFQNGDIRVDYKTFNTAYGKDFGSGISKSDSTNLLSLTDNFGPVYNLAENSYLFSLLSPQVTLNVAFSGTGNGYVYSNPSGVACNTNCSAQFSAGTPVSLYATASQYSIFGGWSNGACSGSGDCQLTLNANSSLTALFNYDSAHQVQVSGGSTTYYSTLQDAYNAAADASSIKLWATNYTGPLICNRPVAVTLEGGYDSNYNSIVGNFILNGALSISGGTVIVHGLSIQ